MVEDPWFWLLSTLLVGVLAGVYGAWIHMVLRRRK